MNHAIPIVIDAHVHAWPAEDLPNLKKNSARFDDGKSAGGGNNWSPTYEASIENTLSVLKNAGAARFVLLAVSSRPDRCRELSRWAADLAKSHPEIIPFGAVHPNTETPEDDVETLKTLGYKAVKLHSLVQMFDPRSDRAEVLFGLLESAGLPILMDSMNLPGAVASKPNLKEMMDLALQAGIQTTAPDIARISENFPKLRIIAAHLGCCYGWDQLGPLLDNDNVWLDLAYIHPLIPPEEVVAIIERKGAERIIYGSDAPYRHPGETLDWFMSLPLSDDDRRKILSENLLELIG